MSKSLNVMAAAILSLSAIAATHHKGAATRPSTTQAAVTPYPLKTCIVSGEEFGGDMGEPVVLNYKGREMKFCCSSCVKKFNKDPEKYIKQLDEAAAKQAAGKKS